MHELFYWTTKLHKSCIHLKKKKKKEPYCILTQRHTCVAQAQEISYMLNELSSTGRKKGAEFTLMRINMFGNSNSLHLTSLCGDKSRETFDNDIFHMISAGWKSAFERQWSPGKLFVDHITTIVLRLSGLRGIRNSFGKQINSSFSWQLRREWEWERKEIEKGRKMNEGKKNKKNWAFVEMDYFSVWPFFPLSKKKKIRSVINNKRMLSVKPYANSLLSDKHDSFK